MPGWPCLTACEGEPQSHSKGLKFLLSLGGAPTPSSLFLNKWITEALPPQSWGRACAAVSGQQQPCSSRISHWSVSSPASAIPAGSEQGHEPPAGPSGTCGWPGSPCGGPSSAPKAAHRPGSPRALPIPLGAPGWRCRSCRSLRPRESMAQIPGLSSSSRKQL